MGRHNPVASVFRVLSPITNLFSGHRNRTEAATSAPTPAAPDVSAELANYRESARQHEEQVRLATQKRTSELETSNRQTQEGIARGTRARRSGGIFTERQTTQNTPSGNLLG